MKTILGVNHYVSKEKNCMFFIGVDLGTSAVKLLLMDGEGKIKKIVSKEYPLYFPHSGWSEQKPEDWYAQTMEGIKELLAETDKSQVAGISFGGQMHGLVILDQDDQVIRPAILWNDGRTFEECDYLNNVIGKEKLAEYTANISFTGFTAPKLLWHLRLGILWKWLSLWGFLWNGPRYVGEEPRVRFGRKSLPMC